MVAQWHTCGLLSTFFFFFLKSPCANKEHSVQPALVAAVENAVNKVAVKPKPD